MSVYPASAGSLEPLQHPSIGATQTPASQARFLVGPDGRGGWIVQDREGLIGGLFANEAAALHFGREACHDNGGDMCRAATGVVLDFGTAPESVH